MAQADFQTADLFFDIAQHPRGVAIATGHDPGEARPDFLFLVLNPGQIPLFDVRRSAEEAETGQAQQFADPPLYLAWMIPRLAAADQRDLAGLEVFVQPVGPPLGLEVHKHFAGLLLAPRP